MVVRSRALEALGDLLDEVAARSGMFSEEDAAWVQVRIVPGDPWRERHPDPCDHRAVGRESLGAEAWWECVRCGLRFAPDPRA